MAKVFNDKTMHSIHACAAQILRLYSITEKAALGFLQNYDNFKSKLGSCRAQMWQRIFLQLLVLACFHSTNIVRPLSSNAATVQE